MIQSVETGVRNLIDVKKGDYLLGGLYRIESDAIEIGNTSKIYKVRHMIWDVDLALKIPREKYLSDGGRELFRNECTAWAELGLHPNVDSCYYVRDIDGVPVIFSEWEEVGSLADAIEDKSLYKDSDGGQQRMIDYALQMLNGLHYVHTKNVIHGDIKPANIMIASEKRIKITDFGLANVRSGRYTRAYCSPEQKRGDTVITDKTDIYSWALTVLQMYSGEHWDDGVDAGVHCKYIFAKANIPEGMKKILKKSLSTDPDERGTAEEIFYEIASEFGSKFSGIWNESVDDTAATLNNRALSYLDILKDMTDKNDIEAMEKKADECWEKALSLFPGHPESMYNRNVRLWETGKINDREVMEAISIGIPDETEFYLSKIKMIRGDEECIRSFEGHDPGFLGYGGPDGDTPVYENNIRSIYFSSDGKKIKSVERDNKEIRIWDIETGECIGVYNDGESPDTEEDWADSKGLEADKRELEMSYPIYVYLHDPETGQIIHTYDFMEVTFPVKFSPDKTMFAANSEKNILKLWRVPKKRQCQFLLSRITGSEKIAEDKNKFDKLFEEANSAYENGDISSAVKLAEEMSRIPHFGKSQEFYLFKKKLAAKCVRSSPSVIKARSFNESLYCGGVGSCSVSPDGKYVLIADALASNVDIWDCDNEKVIKTIRMPDSILDRNSYMAHHVRRVDFNDSADHIFIFYDIYDSHVYDPDKDERYFTVYSLEENRFTKIQRYYNDNEIQINTVPEGELSEEILSLSKEKQADHYLSYNGSVLLSLTYGHLVIRYLDYKLEYAPEKAEKKKILL